MSTVSRKPLTVVIVLLLGLFCTIRDDNGNPVNPGTQQDDDTTTVSDTEITPSLFATPDSAYIFPGDTLGIRVRAFTGSSDDTVQAISGLTIIARSNHGTVIDDTVTTDADGRARFYFTDNTSENIEFTVAANNVEQTIRFEVTETPVRIQKLLQALPGEPIIKADGVSSTTISVSVLNSFRNPIAGECVQFITTAGTIVGNGGNCKGSGQSVTDGEGIASARLISSNLNDTAFVTVYLVSDQSLSDEVEVVFQGMSISVSASKNNIKTGDTAIVTAKVFNASGIPVARTPVFFSRDQGTSSNLSIVYADSLSNYEGVAVARISAGGNGSDIITISAAGTSASLQLNVSSLSIDLELDKTILQTTTTDTVTLTATFTNASGSPLPDRTVKMSRAFKNVQNADTTDTISGTTGSNGKCVFTFTALTWEGIMRLNVTGFENSGQGYASADTMIQFITTRVMSIRPPQPILADGVSKGTVQVFIKNKSGNPVVGDYILFTTTAGVITARSQTDQDGKAEASLTSDRRNITAGIVATLESDPSKTQTTSVIFKGVELAAAAYPPSISSNGRDSAVVLISLLDAAKLPIMGERFNISKQQETTVLTPKDTVTNNDGEAVCKVSGSGSGQDTLLVSAAGAAASVVINYSSNVLIIDTAAGQSCIADSSDSTLITATYLKGNRTEPIADAEIDISVTAGTFDTIFARTLTTDANGKVSFYIKNPHFAVTATFFGLARSSSELTTGSFYLYFKANTVSKIDISGTPEVITTNGGRAKIEAYAYDNLGNRVKDARISFNLVNGPSGGEYLDPPVATTGDDGRATTYLIAGKTPSHHRQVWITAGSFSSVKSDTVKFTIAGPPRYINLGYNIEKGINPNDGTFALPCAAIVTDVNGNPVADGTEVTFSLKISGYVTYRLSSRWIRDLADTYAYCYYRVDSIPYVLPFEDFNDNFRLDPGEDRNRDGMANRGEDIDGNGLFNPGPTFEDINGDGVRQYDLLTPVEQMDQCGGNEILFSDLNVNGLWDPIEPLTDPGYRALYDRLRADSVFWRGPQTADDSARLAALLRLDSLYTEQLNAQPSGTFDIDENGNGIADPHSAVSITRTVKTAGGKALNTILYAQSDALHIEVMIWAESQGVVTETPAQLILPIVLSE